MSTSTNEFDSERVVVIGGSSGFGLATAKAVAHRGAAAVVVSSNRSSVDRALTKLPATAEGHAVDARDPDALEELFARLGPFDHLVFTAGDRLDPKPLAATSAKAAKSFFDLRFWGAFFSAKAASSRIRAGGSIIFTAGLAGRRPSANGALGASTSAALEGLTRALAVELAPIRVNLVVAGVVDTPLWSTMPEAQRSAFLKEVGERLPVQRVGRAEDIAAANVYLMHQRYSTGTLVVVDGGGALR